MVIQDIWTDINKIHNQAVEATGYPTQKPEALLERIMKASSNEGDLVLDCFCGSGTTAAVAEKLNRRWIACDLGRFAIHTTRKRLLNIPDVRPFAVQNLGKYERQLWQAAEFETHKPEAPAKEAEANPSLAIGSPSLAVQNPSLVVQNPSLVVQNPSLVVQNPSLALQACVTPEAEPQRAYVEFILKLYHATPMNGYTWLHGSKAGRMVHVGSVDAPVSTGDVTQIAAEFKKAIGTGKDAPTTNGVDVLGWDFAFEINEVARQQAAAANIRISFTSGRASAPAKTTNLLWRPAIPTPSRANTVWSSR